MTAWSLSAARSLIEGVADGILLLDGRGAVVLHNQAAAALFGVPAGQMVGEVLLDEGWAFTDSAGRDLAGDAHPLRQAQVDGTPRVVHTVGVSRSGGSRRWVHLRVRPLGPVPGMGECWAVVLERATDPRSGRSLFALSAPPGAPDQVVDGLFRQRAVGMVQTLTDGTLVRVNDAFAAMVGRTPAELLGTPVEQLVAPEDVQRDRLGVRRLVRGDTDHFQSEVRLHRADGSTVTTQHGSSALRDADGRCEGLVSIVVDVSRLRRAEHLMSSRALFDPLTQLLNRTLLLDLLGDQLRVREGRLAVVALNLDRFRAVNDSLGLSTGDAVLVQTASRLREVLQPGDAAARISGDDFVLLCGSVATRAQADAFTQRVLDVVAEPIEVDGLRIQLTASAGVSLIDPDSALTADEVMFQATAALSHAKQHGRARWKVFDDAMRVATTDRLRIETSLRTALHERRLHVAYQPLMDLRDGALVGAEALLRWTDPLLGQVAPLEFLPVAEESGLIVPIGAFVLGDAVAQAARWRDGGTAGAHVSVNLSPNELNRPGIAQAIAAALEARALPPEALRLEITESVLVDADAQVRANLAELQALGIAIGIDDFGTGYASMAYLKALPIDFVKIDRQFVSGVASSREDRAIVRAVLDLAAALQLGTVAEGIETPAQLDVVRELGCDLAQGYLIGRPEPAGEVRALLRA